MADNANPSSSSLHRNVWDTTCHSSDEITAQKEGAPPPPAESTEPESSALISLPPPDSCTPETTAFPSLVAQRRTHRTYAKDILSLETVSYLLWATQGLQSTENDGRSLRTVPSAGARHALDTYLLMMRVRNVPRGLYRYSPSRHALYEVSCAPTLIDSLTAHIRNTVLVTGSAITFLWLADLPRMSWKFGARAYRYILLDAGHICQNLYLAAESCGCGCCAIGAFDDDEINTLLSDNPTQKFLVYAASVGIKAPPKNDT